MEKRSFKYLVLVAMYFFVWTSYKNLSHFHTSWCNHEPWRRLWFLTLLLEVWIDSDSLADWKISSALISAVLRIVCLKMSIFGVKRASDEKFCPRTVLYKRALLPGHNWSQHSKSLICARVEIRYWTKECHDFITSRQKIISPACAHLFLENHNSRRYPPIHYF